MTDALIALLLALAQPVFPCGFQPANAIMCIDQYGRLKTPSDVDRETARRRMKAQKQIHQEKLS